MASEPRHSRFKQSTHNPILTHLNPKWLPNISASLAESTSQHKKASNTARIISIYQGGAATVAPRKDPDLNFQF